MCPQHCRLTAVLQPLLHDMVFGSIFPIQSSSSSSSSSYMLHVFWWLQLEWFGRLLSCVFEGSLVAWRGVESLWDSASFWRLPVWAHWFMLRRLRSMAPPPYVHLCSAQLPSGRWFPSALVPWEHVLLGHGEEKQKLCHHVVVLASASGLTLFWKCFFHRNLKAISNSLDHFD